MKAPNKIYVEHTPIGLECSEAPIPFTIGTEYIRKDAILVWAKEQLSSLSESLGVSAKERSTLQTVIDKINSL